MRAIFIGTLNSACATSQATMLTSSCSVTAMIMSAFCAPAAFQHFGMRPVADEAAHIERIANGLDQCQEPCR